MRQTNRFSHISYEQPALIADVRGNSDHPDIIGNATAYWLPDAVYIVTELDGLPPSEVFAVHIHENLVCGEKDSSSPFAEAGGHFRKCSEDMWCGRPPYEAGALPHIFSDENGHSTSHVYIDRANVQDISGRPLVLHSYPRDPSSSSFDGTGIRIACGILAENI